MVDAASALPLGGERSCSLSVGDAVAEIGNRLVKQPHLQTDMEDVVIAMVV